MMLTNMKDFFMSLPYLCDCYIYGLLVYMY